MLCRPLWLGATPLEAGATWPALSLKDQNDQLVVIHATTRHVIFAAEKQVSDMISAMPAMTSRMFAIPKLRELPFPVGLLRDAVNRIPVQRDGKEINCENAICHCLDPHHLQWIKPRFLPKLPRAMCLS